MIRRLTRHDFVNRGRAAVGRFPYCRRTVAEVDALARGGGMAAPEAPPPPPPVLSGVEGRRPLLNLRDAPSSMEALAASWRAKG